MKARKYFNCRKKILNNISGYLWFYTSLIELLSSREHKTYVLHPNICVKSTKKKIHKYNKKYQNTVVHLAYHFSQAQENKLTNGNYKHQKSLLRF